MAMDHGSFIDVLIDLNERFTAFPPVPVASSCDDAKHCDTAASFVASNRLTLVSLQHQGHGFLVGGIPTFLKNMKVSWDDEIPNWMENNPNVPNHQPVLFRGIHFSRNQHSTSFWYWQCVPPHGLEPSPDLFQQSFSKLNLFRFLTERAFSEMMTRRSLSNVWIILSGWWFQPLWKILVKWNYCSQYMDKKIQMFQTTNQLYCSPSKTGMSWAPDFSALNPKSYLRCNWSCPQRGTAPGHRLLR